MFGAENISFGSGSAEPQIRKIDQARAPAPALDSFIRDLENYIFWLKQWD